MYEMRAGPATTSGPGPVWHVMARDDGCTTLCGRHLAQSPSHLSAPTERCCSPCMAAFEEALQFPSGAGE